MYEGKNKHVQLDYFHENVEKTNTIYLLLKTS